MPYLESKKESKQEIEETVTMPNITGLSIIEAENNLKEIGLEIKIDEAEIDKGNTIVQEQIPKEGIQVNKGSKIIIKY